MCLFFIFSFLVNTTKNQILDMSKLSVIFSLCHTLTPSSRPNSTSKTIWGRNDLRPGLCYRAMDAYHVRGLYKLPLGVYLYRYSKCERCKKVDSLHLEKEPDHATRPNLSQNPQLHIFSKIALNPHNIFIVNFECTYLLRRQATAPSGSYIRCF